MFSWDERCSVQGCRMSTYSCSVDSDAHISPSVSFLLSTFCFLFSCGVNWQNVLSSFLLFFYLVSCLEVTHYLIIFLPILWVDWSNTLSSFLLFIYSWFWCVAGLLETLLTIEARGWYEGDWLTVSEWLGSMAGSLLWLIFLCFCLLRRLSFWRDLREFCQQFQYWCT